MKNTIKIISEVHDGVTVTASHTYPKNKDELWKKAGHPNELAPHCIDLLSFNTDSQLAVGNEVNEIHSFLGIRQKYQGHITDFKDATYWEMSTVPKTLTWIFGLPHRVRYQFSDQRIDIVCTYSPKGIFKLPIIKQIIIRRMEKAIKLLLISANS